VSDPELHSVVPIVTISQETLRRLRERERFSEDLFERFRDAVRARFPDWLSAGGRGLEEVFLTQGSLAELLAKHFGETDKDFTQAVDDSVELRRALVHTIPPSDDFTFYVDKAGGAAARAGTEEEAVDVIEDLLGKKEGKEGAASRDGELWLWDEKEQIAASGRVLACSCSRGRKWSITFRRQQEYPARKQNGQFFNTFAEITGLLQSIIFTSDSGEHGLVVIAGRTGSGKSQIARKLIQGYLQGGPAAGQGGRTPHLVTYEDPIEKEFMGPEVGNADCTQREFPEDADSLDGVLLNALRQTPKVVFVGEVRDGGAWKRLLEFAGTGHLVITTAHAGSLVEAMGNILKETDSHTPATRSIVADRLLAVVHLKNATAGKSNVSFLIPAIWHRTPLGIKALMAEGLSSLLPNTPPELEAAGGVRGRLPGSVGRYWFARELAKRAHVRDIAESVKHKAIEWDLEGV